LYSDFRHTAENDTLRHRPTGKAGTTGLGRTCARRRPTLPKARTATCAHESAPVVTRSHSVKWPFRVLVGDDWRVVVPDRLFGEGAVHHPAARRDRRADCGAPQGIAFATVDALQVFEGAFRIAEVLVGSCEAGPDACLRLAPPQ